MTSLNEIQLTPEEGNSIPESAWRYVGETEDYWHYEAKVTLRNGMPGIVRRKSFKDSAELLTVNEELRKENSNRRYTAGMGSDKGGNMPMVHTASIPLAVYYDPVHGIAKRQAAGDKEHLRWWLKSEKAKPFLVREKGLR
jgi:hypothetical protein